MLGRVLVLSASAGAGHLRAADAIEKALKIRGLASEVQHVDVLKYTNNVFRHLYSKAYLDLVNKAPEVLGWLYDHLDVPRKNEKVRLAFDRLNTGAVRQVPESVPARRRDLHPLPAVRDHLVAEAAGEGPDHERGGRDRPRRPRHVALHRAEHYFVALEETKVHLVAIGVPASKVTVSGIPIDPVFAEPKDARAMRRKHGLAEEAFTILVSAGGFGVGPVEHIIQALSELTHPAQVVVVCGRNDELRTRLTRVVRKLPTSSRVSFKLLGFTTEMDELMAAADLFVGKPGGLTTSEALARGLPMVVINPIPGQEERNSDHLLEEGIALRCNNLPALAYKIDRLIDEPGKLHLMRGNALALGKPQAAFTILDRLDTLRTRPEAEPVATPSVRKKTSQRLAY